MIDRLIVLIIFAAVGILFWLLVQRRQRLHLTRLAAGSLPQPLDQRVAYGKPSILYFTSEGCYQCRLQQSPELARFADLTGIAVHELDVVKNSALADYFGVMTLPTTIVLDQNRRPAAVNNGPAPLATLRSQTTLLHP